MPPKAKTVKSKKEEELGGSGSTGEIEQILTALTGVSTDKNERNKYIQELKETNNILNNDLADIVYTTHPELNKVKGVRLETDFYLVKWKSAKGEWNVSWEPKYDIPGSFISGFHKQDQTSRDSGMDSSLDGPLEPTPRVDIPLVGDSLIKSINLLSNDQKG